MRVANVDGRLKLIVPEGAVDVERASQGSFVRTPKLPTRASTSFGPGRAVSKQPMSPLIRRGPVARCPRRARFSLSGSTTRTTPLNRASTARRPRSSSPNSQSSIAGPVSTVQLPPGSVDWEVELVVVIGKMASDGRRPSAWDHVAGLTVGQDLSERELQRSGPAPQFNLAKSYPGLRPDGARAW